MKCLICKKNTKFIEDKKNKWHFFHCEKCEFIFKDPANYVDSTKELKQYQNHNNTMQSSGYVEMFDVFMKITFERYLKNIKTVLEFGSGPGPVLAELLKQKGLDVDIYDKFFAPKKVYENKQYDLITSTEVLEHIQNPVEIFGFFASHLNKGGYLAIMTQFHQNNTSEFQKWWYKNDPTHICFFRPYTFEVLASISGFEVLKHDFKKSVLLKRL